MIAGMPVGVPNYASARPGASVLASARESALR